MQTTGLGIALVAALYTHAAAQPVDEQVERAIEHQVQAVLDHISGVDRTAVQVEVTTSQSEVAGRIVNGSIRELLGAAEIEHLRLELTIDPKKAVSDPKTGLVVQVDRPPNEAKVLVSIAEATAGLNRDLGDELVVLTTSLAEVRAENRQRAEAEIRAQKELEQKRFWKKFGTNAAKFVGVVVALILLGAVLRRVFGDRFNMNCR